MKNTCAVSDCTALAYCRGWCQKHYQRWRVHGDPLSVMFHMYDDRARFWSKVSAGSSTDCWLWSGQVNNHGYGRFQSEAGGTRKRTLAHRQSLAWHLGRDLIRTEIVMHLCDTPRCVNPSHLRIGTQADNVADMRAKGRNNDVGLALGRTSGRKRSRPGGVSERARRDLITNARKARP